MMMHPQRCALMPEKVGHRHRIGLGMKYVQAQENSVFWMHFHCSVPFKKKKKEEFCFKVTLWLVGLLAAEGIAASRWPRFVELAWGLGFGTLFSGNGGVNTKGLVAKGCFIDSEFVCVCRQSGGGRGISKVDG